MIHIHRSHSSPYLGDDFFFKEEQALTQLGNGISYSALECRKDSPDIIITNTHTSVDALLKKFDPRQIKLLIHPNSGYDNFSPQFAKNSSFPVIIGNEIRAQAVTEYILSALFYSYSPIEKSSTWQKTRIWKRKLLSSGKNVLLMGHGHVGSMVEMALSPFQAKITIYDPYQNGFEKLPENVVFDVVILACSLNSLNEGIIAEDFLSRLSPDALIINPARGKLIKTDALTRFLACNPRAKAFLDVFEEEPFCLEEFSHLPNLICTSHIAGVFPELEERMIKFERQVVQDFLHLSPEDFNHRYRNALLINKVRGDMLI